MIQKNWFQFPSAFNTPNNLENLISFVLKHDPHFLQFLGNRQSKLRLFDVKTAIKKIKPYISKYHSVSSFKWKPWNKSSPILCTDKFYMRDSYSQHTGGFASFCIFPTFSASMRKAYTKRLIWPFTRMSWRPCISVFAVRLWNEFANETRLGVCPIIRSHLGSWFFFSSNLSRVTISSSVQHLLSANNTAAVTLRTQINHLERNFARKGMKGMFRLNYTCHHLQNESAHNFEFLAGHEEATTELQNKFQKRLQLTSQNVELLHKSDVVLACITKTFSINSNINASDMKNTLLLRCIQIQVRSG